MRNKRALGTLVNQCVININLITSLHKLANFTLRKRGKLAFPNLTRVFKKHIKYLMNWEHDRSGMLWLKSSVPRKKTILRNLRWMKKYIIEGMDCTWPSGQVNATSTKVRVSRWPLKAEQRPWSHSVPISAADNQILVEKIRFEMDKRDVFFKSMT